MNDTSKKPTGRPSKYTEEIANEICARIVAGESMKSICSSDSMPCVATVFKWFGDYPSFSEKYDKAKIEQAEAFSEELLEIADDGTNDWNEKFDKDGAAIGWQVNNEHIQRSRLRVDTRKWLMSKFKPKKYGDKQEIGGEIVVRTTPLTAGDADLIARYSKNNGEDK